MSRIDTVVEVTYPAEPSYSKTITTVRLSINTFSWLEIKNTHSGSNQMLNRIRHALLKVNPTIPDTIGWSDITVSLPANKPASE